MTGARSVASNRRTVNGLPSGSKTTEPGEKRSTGRSVIGSTTTPPRNPCGRMTRPTRTAESSSVDKLDFGPDALLIGGGSGYGADGAGDSATATDDTAHVPFGGPNLGQDVLGALLDDRDLDLIRIVDDLTNHVADDTFDDLALGHAHSSSEASEVASSVEASSSVSSAVSSETSGVSS